MSLEAITKARKITDIAPRDKFVLMALCDYANDDGFAWPKQSTLSEWTCYNRATVNRALIALEQQGFISSKSRKYQDGRNASKVYKLDFMDRVIKSHTDESRVYESYTVRVDESYTVRVDESYNNNPHLEPPLRTPTKMSFDNDDYLENLQPLVETKTPKAELVNPFYDAWNQNCGFLPKVTKNKNADKLIKTELKRMTEPELIQAIEIAARVVAEDPFWIKKNYGLVNLLRKLDEKVEVSINQNGLSAENAKAARSVMQIMGALNGA